MTYISTRMSIKHYAPKGLHAACGEPYIDTGKGRSRIDGTHIITDVTCVACLEDLLIQILVACQCTPTLRRSHFVQDFVSLARQHDEICFHPLPKKTTQKETPNE